MGVAASIEGGNEVSGAINEVIENLDPPEFLPADKVTDGEDLLLAAKMGCLCQLSYKNTSLDPENKEVEDKFLSALQVSHYKIWDDVSGEGEKKSIDSQALTGVIRNASNAYAKEIPFVCFRGTKSTSDKIHDLMSLVTVPLKTQKGNEIGKTGLGFDLKLTAFKKLGLIEYVMDQVKQFQSGLLVTGHSLGGAIATVFTAEVLHDYSEVFSQQPLTQVTFGAPRVFDKVTALKLNSMNFRNLRFVNEKDLIPTLPHWQMRSLYHTGDCCFAQGGRRLWHTIVSTNIDTHVEDQEPEEKEGEEKDPNGNVGVAAEEKKGTLMTTNHRRFNFASDGFVLADAFEEIFMNFTIGGADSHAMAQYGGYLDQIIHSSPFKKAVAESSEEVKASFLALPVEISKPNETIELGKAVVSLGYAMGKLFE